MRGAALEAQRAERAAAAAGRARRPRLADIDKEKSTTIGTMKWKMHETDVACEGSIIGRLIVVISMPWSGNEGTRVTSCLN